MSRQEINSHLWRRNIVLAVSLLLMIVGGYLERSPFLWSGLLGINLYAFWLMVSDKARARKRRGRIPERSLLWVAALGGAFGTACAMLFAKHKTKHMQFAAGVPALLLVQAICLWYVFGRIFH